MLSTRAGRRSAPGPGPAPPSPMPPAACGRPPNMPLWRAFSPDQEHTLCWRSPSCRRSRGRLLPCVRSRSAPRRSPRRRVPAARRRAPATIRSSRPCDGAPVHRGEVEAAARGLPDQMRQMPMEMLYGMLLDRVIDFRLLADEAERQNVDEDPGGRSRAGPGARRGPARVLVQQTIEEGLTEEKLRAPTRRRRPRKASRRTRSMRATSWCRPRTRPRRRSRRSQGGTDFAELAKERSIDRSAQAGGDLGFFAASRWCPSSPRRPSRSSLARPRRSRSRPSSAGTSSRSRSAARPSRPSTRRSRSCARSCRARS